MTFDHPKAATWLVDSGLPTRDRQAGPCPVHLFAGLRARLSCSRTPADAQEVALLAMRIVMQATAGLRTKEGPPLVREAQQLMDAQHARAIRQTTGLTPRELGQT